MRAWTDGRVGVKWKKPADDYRDTPVLTGSVPAGHKGVP